MTDFSREDETDTTGPGDEFADLGKDFGPSDLDDLEAWEEEEDTIAYDSPGDRV